MGMYLGPLSSWQSLPQDIVCGYCGGLHGYILVANCFRTCTQEGLCQTCFLRLDRCNLLQKYLDVRSLKTNGLGYSGDGKKNKQPHERKCVVQQKQSIRNLLSNLFVELGDLFVRFGENLQKLEGEQKVEVDPVVVENPKKGEYLGGYNPFDDKTQSFDQQFCACCRCGTAFEQSQMIEKQDGRIFCLDCNNKVEEKNKSE